MTDQSRKVETGRVLLCTNSLLMLLEPCQGGKAERVVGDVAKHQAVPGSGLVEPAQLFAESSQLVVEFRMRCHTERLGGQGLGVDRSHLLEGGLVGREQLVDPMEVGSLPHGPEGHPEAVKRDPVKAALKNNFSSEAGTTEARTPEKQAFLANLRWIAEVIFERRLTHGPLSLPGHAGVGGVWRMITRVPPGTWETLSFPSSQAAGDTAY